MTLLVVEEEEYIVEEIRDILDKIDNSIQIVGVTQNIVSIPGWLKNNSIPDLILVNEEVVADLKAYSKQAKAVVTFSTDSEAYHFEAFRFNTLRQLLSKMPVSTGFSGETLPGYVPRTPGPSPDFRERFLVRQGQRLQSIHVNDIAYFFSGDRFIFFKTFDDQKHMTEYRVDRLEKMLDPRRFFRINRSYIVSLATVKQIHAWFGNRLKLYLQPETEKEVLVSRERVKSFKAWLGK